MSNIPRVRSCPERSKGRASQNFGSRPAGKRVRGDADLPDGDERQKRAVKYVADWHRIQMITEDAEVLAVVDGLQQEGSLTEEMEPKVLQAFKNEVGTKGLTEP